jgi:nucleoside permease NupC
MTDSAHIRRVFSMTLDLMCDHQAALSSRAVAIVTYALCGFSNPASVGQSPRSRGVSPRVQESRSQD